MSDESSMTDEEFTLSLVPSSADMQRAGSWMAAQARLDPVALLALFKDAADETRLFQLCCALGETVTQKMRLREDPEEMAALQRGIAHYAGQADQERS